MNVIDKISPKKPLYVRVPTPTNFKSEYERDKYWDGEFKKWHEGYAGLTGAHYFFLQECIIPDADGRPIAPHWRDCDMELFEAWDRSMKNKEDLMIIKRREIGLSTFGGGVMPLYTAFTKPGSDLVMTSASKTRLQSMFRKKTEFIYDKLNPYYKEEKARKTQAGNLFIAKEDKATRTFSGIQSNIWSIDTVKDPYGFESFRASYIFIDEAFIHPKVSVVKASANSSRMKGFDRICPILLGGTCGEMSSAGAQEGLKVYKSSRESNTNVLFLGGTKGIEQFSVNGWCDEKKAEEWILRRREDLARAEDKTEYFKFLTSYPLSIEEVFNLVTDCVLPQEIQISLNTSERKIDEEGIKQGKYTLVTDGTRIIANPDSVNGKVTIIKPPVVGHTYINATDPIPFGNNSLGDGSKYSTVILDCDTEEIVADYTERNLDSQSVVHTNILLQRLYYNAPNMLELNRGEVVMKEYLGAGMEKLLALMPTHLGITFEERKYPFGFYMNNHIAARCENLVMKWLYAHAHNIRHKQLIQEIRHLGTKMNTDLLDAVKGALLYLAEKKEIDKKNTFTPTIHRTYQLVRNNRGELVRKEVTTQLIR